MKGSEYICKVYEQLLAPDSVDQAHYAGAFLHAALAVIEVVDSPLKEQTLVDLALIELSSRRKGYAARKRAA
jgi:hypothetical protein